jgi:uncharacterized protein
MRFLTRLTIVALVALGCVTSAWAALDFPGLTGRVVDEAGILSPQFKQEISAQLAAHEQATTNQVVVVTLKSLRGDDISDYGYQLGRHWGIGQKDKNNGVLLIIAPNEKKLRIEVGYGLEGALTDAESRSIIERIIKPALRQNDFQQAIRGGVSAILAAINGEYRAPPPVSSSSGGGGNLLGPLIIGLFVLQWIFGAVARRASTGTRATAAGVIAAIAGVVAWFIIGVALLAILIALFVFVFMLIAGGRMGPGGSGYGNWGGGGGGWGGGWGGGDGGGFSGGGGSFGGGGASGDW